MNRETPTFPCACGGCNLFVAVSALDKGVKGLFCLASCRRGFEKRYRKQHPDVTAPQLDQLLAALRVVVLTGRTSGRLPSGAGFSDLSDIAPVPDFWRNTIERIEKNARKNF
jgi:hypothetical protein